MVYVARPADLPLILAYILTRIRLWLGNFVYLRIEFGIMQETLTNSAKHILQRLKP